MRKVLRREVWSADDVLLSFNLLAGELVRVASNGDYVLSGGWVAMGRIGLPDGSRMVTYDTSSSSAGGVS